MKAFRTLCLATTLLGLLGLAAPAAMAACAPPSASAAMQSELLAHLNAERKARGLAPLRLNDALDKAAQRHACDNAKRRTTSHVSGDGSKLQHRLNRVGYDYQAAAENTGRGFSSGKRAVQWWMASPGHKKNMLMPEVREVGIGIAMSDAPDSRLHWILVMGRSF